MKGPRLIVRALIVESGRLLVNRHDSRLALFGGHLEKGENARQALARELSEELSLRVEPGPLVYVVENFFANERGRRIHELGLYYLVQGVPPLVKAREPHLHPQWLALAELAASTLRPRALRDHLAQGLPHETVELVEIDRAAFPEML